MTPIDVSVAGFERLQDFIANSFTGGTAKPVPLGLSYGIGDAFFEGEGHFNALVGCNTWTAAGLRSAGVTTGLWTPLPFLLTRSLTLHNGGAATAAASEPAAVIR